jgi:hypothetical protein
MKTILKSIVEKKAAVLIVIFVLVVIAFIYFGFLDNYFYSDDFEWLSRAVLAQHPADFLTEVFKIEGRDFNPVFVILLSIIVRFFGLSPLAFRLISLLTFSGVIFMFFFILIRYFNVNRIIALSAALLFGLNVYLSEVVLNLAALVYSLSLLFFMISVKYYLDRRRTPFLVFLLLAVFTKETVILGFIPLIAFEIEKKNRWFLIASITGMTSIRVILQLVLARSGTYTGFLTVSDFFVKFYYIVLKTMNISPYTTHPVVGAGIIVLIIAVAMYFIISKKVGKLRRGFLFFFLFFIVFSFFLSLLPKLSSRYFFYPAPGFWGIAALIAHYFYQDNKKLKYALVPLVLISILFNYPLISGEIDDYRILGNFSKEFIQRQGAVIKEAAGEEIKTSETILYKLNRQPLAEAHARVRRRGNLPKLLPFREHGIGGVIEPRHLVPLVFYPHAVVRWKGIKETTNYFIGTFEKR